MAGRLMFSTRDMSWERERAVLKGEIQRREIQQFAREVALRAGQDVELTQESPL